MRVIEKTVEGAGVWSKEEEEEDVWNDQRQCGNLRQKKKYFLTQIVTDRLQSESESIFFDQSSVKKKLLSVIIFLKSVKKISVKIFKNQSQNWLQIVTNSVAVTIFGHKKWIIL